MIIKAPYIDVHTHNLRSSGRGQLAIYNQLLHEHLPAELPEGVLVSAGLHPWYCDLLTVKELLRQLEWIKQRGLLVALGEVGLDKRKGPDLSVQQYKLEQQLEWAEENDLPVVVHNVKCDDILLSLRKKFASATWIMHGFRGNQQQASQWLDKGGWLSMGASALRNEQKALSVLKTIELDHLFLETDDTREPSIVQVYAVVARLMNVDIETLKTRIANNFERVFGYGAGALAGAN